MATDRYQRLFDMLLDAIPSSVLLVDPQLRVAAANRNFLERARRTSADTLGQRVESVFPAVIVEQMELLARVRRAFDAEEATHGRRLTYRAPGVATRVYYYSLLPFRHGGRVEHVLLLMEDVTDQLRLGEEARRAERHLASVIESASDLVVSTDPDGVVLSWNAAAERLSGLKPEVVRGMDLAELCGPAGWQTLDGSFRRVREGVGFVASESELLTRDGGRLPVVWSGSPMKDDLGRVVGVVLVGRDRTEVRKLEAQLLRTQKLGALGVLAGGIAHELRNPLAISSSAAQFLLEKPEDPAFAHECMERVVVGIRRASDIIENLLRFARPGGQPELQRLDLCEGIRAALGLIANQARLQQVEVVPSLPRGRVEVDGVPSMLQQVWMNLFLNALGAMPHGGRLAVSAKLRNHVAEVGVKDTGAGIAREDLEKIFDPFFTTRPPGQGTGLGLSICHAIVQQHSGAIDVESSESEGSTFTVRLPAP